MNPKQNLINKESNINWINFSFSLFPNTRLFTRDEQKKFEALKRKKFKRFKLKMHREKD